MRQSVILHGEFYIAFIHTTLGTVVRSRDIDMTRGTVCHVSH